MLRLGRHLQHPAAGDRARLRDRKVANIEATGADVIADRQHRLHDADRAARPAIPIVHTVELLDWANGGPQPAALARA